MNVITIIKKHWDSSKSEYVEDLKLDSFENYQEGSK